MAVDVHRNDLGRIGRIGSVTLRDRCEAETHAGAHRQGLTVPAVVRDGTGGSGDLLLFRCVASAPERRGPDRRRCRRVAWPCERSGGGCVHDRDASCTPLGRCHVRHGQDVGSDAAAAGRREVVCDRQGNVSPSILFEGRDVARSTGGPA